MNARHDPSKMMLMMVRATIMRPEWRQRAGLFNPALPILAHQAVRLRLAPLKARTASWSGNPQRDGTTGKTRSNNH
jgi:hypothetical protein